MGYQITTAVDERKRSFCIILNTRCRTHIQITAVFQNINSQEFSRGQIAFQKLPGTSKSSGYHTTLPSVSTASSGKSDMDPGGMSFLFVLI